MGEASSAAQDTTEAADVSADGLYDKDADETGDVAGDVTDDGGETGEDDADKDSEGETGKDADTAEKGKVPEKYDLKAVENSLLEPADMERIAAEARELGLTNEEAQLLMDDEEATVKRYHDRLSDAAKAVSEGWLQEAKTDKEIGGANFNENVELANRVIDKFASKEFKAMLNSTRYGNHPEMIRFCSKIGRLMAEDKIHLADGGAPESKSLEDRLYGKAPE